MQNIIEIDRLFINFTTNLESCFKFTVFLDSAKQTKQ